MQFIQRLTQDDYYHSVVVLANEKTVLKAEEAPKEIRDQVVRADQLVEHIKQMDKAFSRKNPRDSFKEQMDFAKRWLSRNVPTSVDLAGRYEIAKKGPKPAEMEAPLPSVPVPSVPEPSSATPNAEPVPSLKPVAQDSANSEPSSPQCPLCGAPMVIRKARYGEHKGERFWGCSMYGKTRCKGIVSIRAM